MLPILSRCCHVRNDSRNRFGADDREPHSQDNYRRFAADNMPGIASSATMVAVGHIAGGRERIRVGAGGLVSSIELTFVVAKPSFAVSD